MPTSPLLIAQNAQATAALLPALANRHGLITGATGTGKTVTLQALAEQLPQFLAHLQRPIALPGFPRFPQLP